MARSSVRAAALLLVASLLILPLPAFAYTSVAFDPRGNPNANPDGSFPVGAKVYVVVQVDLRDNCNSVEVDWDDGSTTRTTTANQISHVSHSYDNAGTYHVSAGELCGQYQNVGNYLTIDVASPLPDPTILGLGAVFIVILIAVLASRWSQKRRQKRREAEVEPPKAEPDVNLDKKTPLLKTAREVDEQKKFFDEQRTRGGLEPGGKVYVDKWVEAEHRLTDDPLTKYTVGSYLKVMEDTADLIHPGSPKVKYDPDVDKYYYDFHDQVTREEAAVDLMKSSFESVAPNVKHAMFKGLSSDYKYLQALGDPAPGTPIHFQGEGIYKHSPSFDYQRFLETLRYWRS